METRKIRGKEDTSSWGRKIGKTGKVGRLSINSAVCLLYVTKVRPVLSVMRDGILPKSFLSPQVTVSRSGLSFVLPQILKNYLYVKVSCSLE